MITSKSLSMTPRNVRRRQRREEQRAQGMTRCCPRPKSPMMICTPSATMIPKKIIKNHFVIVVDGSGSMGPHANGAARLFNEQLALLESSKDQQNSATVFEFIDNQNIREKAFNVPTEYVGRYDERRSGLFGGYPCSGGDTPLYDAVIKAGRRAMCDDDPDVAFVMIVLTDGQRNSGFKVAADLQQFIAEAQATGRWTFAFLLPPRYKEDFIRTSGVPRDNVQEWTNIDQAREETQHATSEYLTMRKTSGGQSMRSQSYFFHTDLSNVPKNDLANLREVTNEVKVYDVAKEAPIRLFVEQRHKLFAPGAAYYELMKREKQVQDYKHLLLQDKSTGRVYADASPNRTVRGLLGLPDTGDVRLDPGNHANYRIFIQSMSTNRILSRGTKLAYWER